MGVTIRKKDDGYYMVIREPLIPRSKRGKDESIDDVKLKNIIEYADGVASKIIEKKVRSILDSGRDLKTVLVKEEKLPERKYFNYYSKLRRRIGQIKELKKAVI